MLDHTLKREAVRRVEVIMGSGRRRRFSAYKARVVEETLAPGMVVSEVAQRHGLSPFRLAPASAAATGDLTGLF